MRRILRDISVIVIVILSAILIVISVISASIFITGCCQAYNKGY